MNRQVRKNNINRHFSLIATLIFCVCLLFFSIIQFAFMDDVFLFVEQKSMIKAAKEITELSFDDEDFYNILSEYEANKNIYIEIYSPRETLFYTTGSNQAIYEPDSSEESAPGVLKPRIMKIISRNELEDGDYFEIRQESYSTAKYVVYGAFFGNNNGIEIYHSVDVIRENANITSWTVFVASCIFAFFILMVAFVYIESITTPLMIINNKTKKIRNLDFSETCPEFKQKDLNELSENINSLSASLNNALNTLKSENLKLERDIEHEKHHEKIIRSFSANLSHELKTPISIISGYAEGMKLGIGCDSTEEFCDIIIEESEKMNTLINRLMEYLQYGSEFYKINCIDFNIYEFINERLRMQKHKLDSRNAQIKTNIDEGFCGYGDPKLLANIFDNYLSNALSHLDFEREIIISVKENENNYTVSVFNTGKNIPGTDIENIWQSFYRADKSHSRAEGRFGLGLSIVATLQKLHEQKYGCRNLEKGVEFWFDIKKSDNM